MSLDQDVRFGVAADRAMKDPAITKAFEDVEAAIIQGWAKSPIRDRDGQHEFKLMLKLLGDLRANLEQALADGKLAAEELRITEQRKSPIEKLRSFIR